MNKGKHFFHLQDIAEIIYLTYNNIACINLDKVYISASLGYVANTSLGNCIFFTCCVMFQLLITTAISDRKVISLINSCHTCWTSLILFAFRTFPMRCKRAHLPLDLDRHGTLFEAILQFSNKVFTF